MTKYRLETPTNTNDLYEDTTVEIGIDAWFSIFLKQPVVMSSDESLILK